MFLDILIKYFIKKYLLKIIFFLNQIMNLRNHKNLIILYF